MFFSGDSIEFSLRRDYCGSGGPTPNAAGPVSGGGGGNEKAGGGGKNDEKLQEEAKSATPQLSKGATSVTPGGPIADKSDPFSMPAPGGASLTPPPVGSANPMYRAVNDDGSFGGWKTKGDAERDFNGTIQSPGASSGAGNPGWVDALSNPHGFATKKFMEGVQQSPDGGFFDKLRVNSVFASALFPCCNKATPR